MSVESSAAIIAAMPRHSIRQTYLRFLCEQCPAGAYALAVEGREGPHGMGADRGTAVHEVFSRYVTHLFETGRQTDFEAAHRIAREVLQDFPALDAEARIDVRDQAEKIGEGFLLDAAHYYGSEEALAAMYEVPGVGSVRVTGRADLIEADVGEGWARITDAKSNHQIWPDSRVQRDFQLKTYALLLLDGVLPGLEYVEGYLWLTRYNKRLPQSGPAVFTREDLDEHREYLIDHLAAFYGGKLARQFVPGAWCQYCPRARPGDCARWSAYTSTTPPPIRTQYQARRMAGRVIALEQERETLLGLLKEYANEHGNIRVGDTEQAEVFGFHASESEEIDVIRLWSLLEAESGRVGPPEAFLDAFRVDRRSKGFRRVRDALGALLDDAVTVKTVTRFGHKGEEDA